MLPFCKALSAMARKPLRRAWTPEDTALLANLLRVGKGYGQIARKMNRSRKVLGSTPIGWRSLSRADTNKLAQARAEAPGTESRVSHWRQARVFRSGHADPYTWPPLIQPPEVGGFFCSPLRPAERRGPWLEITSFWRVQARLPLEPWVDRSHVRGIVVLSP